MNKRVFKLTNFVILSIFIIVLCYIVGYRIIKPDKFIEKFGFNYYHIANTKSMEPELKHLDLVVIKNDFMNIEIGDYITFKSQLLDGTPILVTHEVVDRFQENNIVAYRTKGVNLERFDSRLVTLDGIDNTNMYVGTVVYHNRFLGRFISYTTSVFGIINIVSSIIIIALLTILFKHYNNYTHEPNEKRLKA